MKQGNMNLILQKMEVLWWTGGRKYSQQCYKMRPVETTYLGTGHKSSSVNFVKAESQLASPPKQSKVEQGRRQGRERLKSERQLELRICLKFRVVKHWLDLSLGLFNVRPPITHLLSPAPTRLIKLKCQVIIAKLQLHLCLSYSVH